MMIDTDKYENMRLLFLDFIVTASDEVDEEAWRDKLIMLDELLAEVKRLREVILDFSLPMWNYLNGQVHPDQEEFTANAVKSLVKNTPYESLMHLWEDACGYLPDPDCDDTPRNKPVWNRESEEE